MAGWGGTNRSWIDRHPFLTVLLTVALVLFLVGIDGEDDGPPASTPDLGRVDDDRDSPRARKHRKDKRRGGRPSKSAQQRPEQSSPRPSSKPEPPPRQSTYLVTRIVDGDTVELGNGKTVRLVGIDTPEAGECGFEAASDTLGELILGQQVRLTLSDENLDQYGRLLRYVDVGTMDAGLRLIKRGLAVARYDSRDGYGRHPREASYVDADVASRNLGCPRPVPLVGSRTGGGSCAPGYNPCIPPYPPDLDCGDLDGPIMVSGSDPHGLDADGDGVACES